MSLRQPRGRHQLRQSPSPLMNSYRPVGRQPLSVPASTPKGISFRLKLTVLLALVLFAAGHIMWTQHVSAETAATKRAAAQQAALRARKEALFATQVQTVLAAHPELTISVTVAPTSGAQQHFGSTDSFDAASTGKLVTATDFLRHVERGTASLSTDIDGQSAEHWLNLMIINSDDAAWMELNTYLGHDDLQTYADSIGLTTYDASTNTLTARDITTVLQALYGRKLLNNSDRSLLLSYLARANYRDFAVSGVPTGDTVYHKIGMDNDCVHDALIIVHGNESFVLTIFTDGHGIYNWDVRKQIMQTLATEASAAYL